MLKQLLAGAIVVLLCLTRCAGAEKPKPAKVTVILRGARTASDAKAFRTALAKLKGINTAALSRASWTRYRVLNLD